MRYHSLVAAAVGVLLAHDPGRAEREAEYFHGLARTYRELAEAKDRGEFGYSPQTQSLRIAVEPGVRINEALGGWAEWAAGGPPAESGLS